MKKNKYRWKIKSNDVHLIEYINGKISKLIGNFEYGRLFLSDNLWADLCSKMMTARKFGSKEYVPCSTIKLYGGNLDKEYVIDITNKTTLKKSWCLLEIQ